MKIIFLDVLLVLRYTHTFVLHTLHTVLHMHVCANKHTKTQKIPTGTYTMSVSESLERDTHVSPKKYYYFPQGQWHGVSV